MWYPRILPKNERTNSFFWPNSNKNEFVHLFFGRIRGYQKVLLKLSDLQHFHYINQHFSNHLSANVIKVWPLDKDSFSISFHMFYFFYIYLPEKIAFNKTEQNFILKLENAAPTQTIFQWLQCRTERIRIFIHNGCLVLKI